MGISTGDGQYFDTEYQATASRYTQTGAFQDMNPGSYFIDPMLDGEEFDDGPTRQQKTRDGSIADDLFVRERLMEKNLQRPWSDEMEAPNPQKVGLIDSITSFFRSEPKKEDLSKAPPMAKYPTSDDVEFARSYGFYKDMYEPWTEGRIVNQIASITDTSISGLTEEKAAKITQSNPELAEVFAKASLVSNRIPIAALGFDPSKINVIEADAGRFNLGGGYGLKTDRMFVVSGSTGAMVHESIHRGVKALMKDPEARKLIEQLPEEEYIVRYLMATQAGNPEKGEGSAGDAQIKSADYWFNSSMKSTQYKEALDKLTEIAQKKLSDRSGHAGRRR